MLSDISVDRIRHVFQSQSQRDVKYVLVCDVPRSQQAAFEKILPWLEEHARFSLVVAAGEIDLGFTSNGDVIPPDDAQD
jgi:hypothetical protein